MSYKPKAPKRKKREVYHMPRSVAQCAVFSGEVFIVGRPTVDEVCCVPDLLDGFARMCFTACHYAIVEFTGEKCRISFVDVREVHAKLQEVGGSMEEAIWRLRQRERGAA